MKFYIFASDNDTFVSYSKSAVFASHDYEETLSVFNDLNKEYAFCNSYLIVDFEYKHSNIFGYDSYENLKDHIVVPFLIINEFHYDKETYKCNAISPSGKFDANRTIRKDSITIETSGFVEEYNNNAIALQKFIYYLDNHIPAIMSLLFVEEKGNDKSNMVISEYKRKLASTIDCLRGRRDRLKKIKLSKDFKLDKYEFPKHKFYNFTFDKEEEPA